MHVLGVRHHGPGSARSVLEALEELDPDVVLVEGAPELAPLVPFVADPGLVPPVAGLVYAVDEPGRASFYPMAEFSPEWVALRWAVARGRRVELADLPAAHLLATRAAEDAEAGVPVLRDPVGDLARAAGYDDPERWWEDAVEHRSGTAVARFDALREAMAAVRAAGPGDDLETRRREAAMRRSVRAALRAGAARVAFVCGAYHAPAVHPDARVPVKEDTALLAGLPKVKVTATWAPWTAGRLAVASGYGAGVTAPGWYQHLFVEGARAGATPEDVTASWLVRVGRALRDEQLDAPPASIVEATRLAQTLAVVRGRPSVGLTEVTDAAQTVLCGGSTVPLELVHRTLVVGEAMGAVPESVPMVPLAADLARRQRALRMAPSASVTVLQLDLRKEQHRERSLLLHRLLLLDVPWGRPAAVTARTTGTFREAWQLEWVPELSVRLVEAGLRGTTVPAATEGVVRERAAAAADLSALADLVEQCLLCDLPDALTVVLAALERQTAQQHDPLTLLRTVEPLARTCRYGDVRAADTAGVARVLRTVVTRVAVGLRAACTALDDDAGALVREAVESAHRGVRLLDEPALDGPWRRGLTDLARDERVHAAVSGRVHRLLLDDGTLEVVTVAERMSRRLSVGAPAPAGAAWLDGFLEGDALLLVHDPTLLSLVDEWVAGVDDATFEDLLPLLRRAFARFSDAERREVGHRLRAPGVLRAQVTRLDVDRALPAVHATARLLGLEPVA
ncbi:hypothetical protein E5225_05305 [Cellulomonas shaoxiangyii]|uniref:Uncharacterized protein n=1 Tax=Cellulomonas shaoxiangyii TaxID=2566013 RepID=A0A4V1CN49_9CELL|nr:hypothetical protein E5225_05305 [Cellulomonas shaoxiangyii]TGY83006.1 hypothetical protein E5226_12630 [Cellulomonas shaoxiangyii]